ncbi:MAG TPA: hypothetical protein VJU78_18190 [Chitinophagaceae bacterium]|nr:hypothetical protein [Chitinophagaceae bacterium]
MRPLLTVEDWGDPNRTKKKHAAVGIFLSPTAGLKQVGNNQCSHEDEYSFSSTTSLYHRIVDWRNNNQDGEERAFEDHQARLLKSWSRYHKFIY